MTETEQQQAESLIAELEIAVGEISPRDNANAALIRGMIHSLNGLRSLLGLERSKH